MIGRVLGNYKIINKIGEGGMGAVYIAKDLTLERKVALKIIAPRLAKNPKLMTRFKIEAVAQARLTHPNVVTIYSFEQIGDLYFIVMEYIDGVSLKQLIKTGKLDLNRALDIYKQVLNGIAFAHLKGVIHRDLKPANILITEDGVAKIGDFGIAKLEGVEGLTKAGTSLGTPLYSAPEQILGRKVDYRADIYSLGILLFEMLTGRPPFISRTGSDYEVQKAHIEKKPPLPSSINPRIPIHIERIILKCLEKEASRRFQSVRDLKEAIEEAISSSKVRRKRVIPIREKLSTGISTLILKARRDPRILLFLLAAMILISMLIIMLAETGSKVSHYSLQTSAGNRQLAGGRLEPEPSGGIALQPLPGPPQPQVKRPESQPSAEAPKSTEVREETAAQVEAPAKKKIPQKKKTTTKPSGSEASAEIYSLVSREKFSEAASKGQKFISMGIDGGDLFLHTGRAYFLVGDYSRAEKYLGRAFSLLGYVKFEVVFLPGWKKIIGKNKSTGWLIIAKEYLKYSPAGSKSSSFIIKRGELKKVKPTKKPWEKEFKLFIESKSKVKAKFKLRRKKTNKKDVELMEKFIIKSLKGG